jgi:hypothetical protein
MAVNPRNNVVSIGELVKRVDSLEAQMSEVIPSLKDISEKVDTVLDVLTTVRGISGFLKKHGPRMIAFGTGIATAAGIGNPEVWRFIGHFFGS